MDGNHNFPNSEQGDDLQQQLQLAHQEAAENYDKYLRALAESENMRKRLERLCENRMWHEKKRLVTHLLELNDPLEEALKYAASDDAVAAGLRLVHQQLQKVLAQEGVQALQSVGETFDPTLHEAVELTDDPDQENKVTFEYRKGYQLDGKLLRPARVQVAKNQQKK